MRPPSPNAAISTPFLRHWLKRYYLGAILSEWRRECPGVTAVVISIASTTRARGHELVETIKRVPAQRVPLKRFDKPSASLIPTATPQGKQVGRKPNLEKKLGEVVVALKPESSRPNFHIEDIRAFVMRHYKMSEYDMNSTRRLPVPVRQRRVGMYLAKTLTRATLEEIGKQFGNRTAQTARSAIDNARVEVTSNKTFAEEIKKLIRVIQAEASIMG